MALTDKLTAIAAAIRGISCKTALMTVDQMTTEIDAIHETWDDMIHGSIAGHYKNATVERIGSHSMYAKAYLTSCEFSSVTEIWGGGCYGCSRMESARFPVLRTINNTSFSGCAALEALILDQITAVPNLVNVSAFNNTPIADGTGYVYVPDNLVDAVKAATNWTTFADQIKGISELPAALKTLYGI